MGEAHARGMAFVVPQMTWLPRVYVVSGFALLRPSPTAPFPPLYSQTAYEPARASSPPVMLPSPEVWPAFVLWPPVALCDRDLLPALL